MKAVHWDLVKMLAAAFVSAVVAATGTFVAFARNTPTRSEVHADVAAALANSPYSKDKSLVREQLDEQRAKLVEIDGRLRHVEQLLAQTIVLLQTKDRR